MIKRHPDAERFHQLLREVGEMHDRKQKDYGREEDPFANVKGAVDWGVPAWVGVMVRINDKIRRLQTLIKKGKLENESAEDSLRDIMVYSGIALVLFEKLRKDGQ
jgi:hypothetical protein